MAEALKAKVKVSADAQDLAPEPKSPEEAFYDADNAITPKDENGSEDSSTPGKEKVADQLKKRVAKKKGGVKKEKSNKAKKAAERGASASSESQD